MRAFTAYLAFTAIAMGIAAHAVGGMVSDLADLQSERNAQIQQLSAR